MKRHFVSPRASHALFLTFILDKMAMQIAARWRMI
jgi:hypothetical protein